MKLTIEEHKQLIRVAHAKHQLIFGANDQIFILNLN